MVRAGKRFSLFISNEDKDDIIRIVKSLEKSGLIIDIATETLKHEIKIQQGGFACALTPTASSLMLPVASSMINAMWKMGNESRKRTRIWISLITSITVNDESSGETCHKRRKKI